MEKLTQTDLGELFLGETSVQETSASPIRDTERNENASFRESLPMGNRGTDSGRSTHGKDHGRSLSERIDAWLERQDTPRGRTDWFPEKSRNPKESGVYLPEKSIRQGEGLNRLFEKAGDRIAEDPRGQKGTSFSENRRMPAADPYSGEKGIAPNKAEGDRILAGALREIAALDPSVKTPEDLSRNGNFDKIVALVKKGNTIADAYRLANFDALTRRARAASRQAALNEAAQKSHMTVTRQQGSGGVSVPSDVLMTYRSLLPSASEAEIHRHYNRYIGS